MKGHGEYFCKALCAVYGHGWAYATTATAVFVCISALLLSSYRRVCKSHCVSLLSVNSTPQTETRKFRKGDHRCGTGQCPTRKRTCQSHHTFRTYYPLLYLTQSHSALLRLMRSSCSTQRALSPGYTEFNTGFSRPLLEILCQKSKKRFSFRVTAKKTSSSPTDIVLKIDLGEPKNVV